MPPAVEARSPNHWTAREVPEVFRISSQRITALNGPLDIRLQAEDLSREDVGTGSSQKLNYQTLTFRF